MRSAIDELLEESLAESTTTGSMPTATGGATVIAPPGVRSKGRLARLLRRRRPDHVRESDGSVIPDDAKLDGEESAEKTADPDKKPLPDGSSFIPTSVALVAPDYTPNAEVPLSPTQVPPSQKALEPDSDSVLRTLLGAHQAQFKPGLIANTGSPVADPAATVASTIESMSAGAADAAAKTAAAKAIAEARAGGKFEVPIVQPGSAAKISSALRMIMGNA